MIGGFAQSTIEATIHVICHQPELLKQWLAEHPPCARLEKIARAQIKSRREARAREST